MKRILTGLFFCALLLYNGCARGESARSAVLIEADTGRVLYEHNAHEALPMASTTKIMTALLALENGDLQDAVTAGPDAFAYMGGAEGLKYGYLDFLAWDLRPVLDEAGAFFRKAGRPGRYVPFVRENPKPKN